MKSSRRTFLGQLATIPLVSCAGTLNLFALPGGGGRVALLQDDKPFFPHPEVIRYDAQCFTIHGQDALIYSAAFHYCRTPKELWRDRMTKLKLAGFNTIETYVFWNYHEPVEGQVDMSQLEEFVALTKELGLWMILRVGPYVCAEWDAGGFPHWLIAKQVPLRSDSPESIRSSQDWYNHVLPIVKKNMITAAGPVIMIQIENEYDYWKIPDQQKVNYITALAHMVWAADIDIPIITNWVSQVRQNKNPVMARLMDTGDFYPRWNIQKEVVPALATLRKEEPTCPIGIAELQGGWFSQYGGKLSADQDGVSAAQLNLLTKTVIESSTAFLNFYMAHGGTNFEWAARKVTTTYDYAAPISEPGGLWAKYYAARTIGCFLDKFGPALVRTGEATALISSEPKVSATMRSSRNGSFLFIREEANEDEQFQLTLGNLAVGAQKTTIPSEGKLSINARGMNLLPVDIAIPGGHLRYTTAEVLTFGTFGERNYLVVYAEPGEAAEIALAAQKMPTVLGASDYLHFDFANKTAILGFHIELAQQMFLWDGKLQIVVLPRQLAERTWPMDLPTAVGKQSISSPVVTDCALMAASSATQNSAAATLHYATGEHLISALLPVAPAQCLLDGKAVDFLYDAPWQTVRLRVSTPPLPLHPVVLADGEWMIERFTPTTGDWLNTPPVALENLGRIPYGYVKYRVDFEYHGEQNLSIETHTEDSKQVFLNGKHVPELSSPKMSVSVGLAQWAKTGSNTLEISYEAFGSENGNKEMSQLKGIFAIRLSTQQKSVSMNKVSLQRYPAGVSAHGLEEAHVAGGWKTGKVGESSGSGDLVPAFTWFRTSFTLSAASDWFAPWRVKIDAERDALLYINEHFIGYYQAIGPQSEFYLPEPYLHMDGTTQNLLTVIIAYSDGLQPLKELVVSPYTEFATRTTQVEFHWK